MTSTPVVNLLKRSLIVNYETTFVLTGNYIRLVKFVPSQQRIVINLL